MNPRFTYRVDLKHIEIYKVPAFLLQDPSPRPGLLPGEQFITEEESDIFSNGPKRYRVFEVCGVSVAPDDKTAIWYLRNSDALTVGVPRPGEDYYKMSPGPVQDSVRVTCFCGFTAVADSLRIANAIISGHIDGQHPFLSDNGVSAVIA